MSDGPQHRVADDGVRFGAGILRLPLTPRLTGPATAVTGPAIVHRLA